MVKEKRSFKEYSELSDCVWNKSVDHSIGCSGCRCLRRADYVSIPRGPLFWSSGVVDSSILESIEASRSRRKVVVTDGGRLGEFGVSSCHRHPKATPTTQRSTRQTRHEESSATVASFVQVRYVSET